MSYKRYRWCIVPSCTNTSVKTPKKLFIRVPGDINVRNIWLELAKRDPKSLSVKTRLYLCEDHFNLEQDMENYMEYKIMGSVKYVRIKANVTPSRFCCQSDREGKRIVLKGKSKKKMLGPYYNDVAERLYLQRDSSGDISIPCSGLGQHQIDGVRFLFSQFSKQRLGVIQNFPPGCGSSVQVAIFISAILEKLKKPVLILYDTDKEKEAWLTRFAQWTDIGKEIEVDAPNAYVRKQIFIKNLADIGKFYRRSWGIVVVKSDNFKNIFLKCQLEVEFKIWITAQDLKKDKELLRLVYDWINPLDELLLQQYLIPNSPVLFNLDSTNEMLLDLLLEDFVFTRRCVKPFGACKRKHEPDFQPAIRVSKKNKDATGKKIKRSKKVLETPSTSTITIENVVTLQGQDNPFEASTASSEASREDNTADDVKVETEDKNNDEAKMDVESFIRDNDPLQSDLSFTIRQLDSSSTDAEDTHNVSAVDESKDLKNDQSDFSFQDKVTEEGTSARDTPEAEVKGSAGLSRIDIRKIFYASTETRSYLIDRETGENKTESLKDENGKVDQETKLEVSTSVLKETEGSFDSKIKELEERALKKFKGSVLDNIF